MKQGLDILAAACAAVVTALAAGSAQAQVAGSLMLRAGATQIKPNVDSGDLSAPALPHSQADIRSDTQFSAGLTYMLTDSIAIDLPLALPFKHEIVGDGAMAGVGKIGEVRALPITVMGQYRFLDAKSAFRPYVGAGLTYAKFYKAKSTAALSALTGGTPANPTTLSVDSKLAATVQIGASYAFDAHWFVDATVLHTFLKTRTTLSNGQTLDTKINPDTFALSVGYTF
ncbi:MAG: OmpW family outer membrane protein [Rhizobacter sp.]